MKRIPGYPNYSITKDGGIWSHGHCKFLNGHIARGYREVYLCIDYYSGQKPKRQKIHSLVLETYIGPRPRGGVTRHLNGDKLDNRLENLCWGTQKENHEERERHGNTPKGETCGLSKLTAGRVCAIRTLYEAGFTQQNLARLYNVHQTNIHHIVTRKTWKHI